MPDAIAPAERDRLTKTGLDRVRTRVQPSFARLLEFLDREYLPASYEQVGWWQTNGGGKGYEYLVRLYTTTNLSPQDIHALGLQEVARIRARMESIKNEVGFSGTLAQFFTHLRTDPKYFYRTSEDLLDGYRAVAKRVDPELIRSVEGCRACRTASFRFLRRLHRSRQLLTPISAPPMAPVRHIFL